MSNSSYSDAIPDLTGNWSGEFTLATLTTTIHEGTHAMVCLLLGGELKEFSALHVLCHADGLWQKVRYPGVAAMIEFEGRIVIVFIKSGIVFQFDLTRILYEYNIWIFHCIERFDRKLHAIKVWENRSPIVSDLFSPISPFGK